MAMTPEERRKRDRERKARQRAAAQAKPKLEALPKIGPGSASDGGTQGGTTGGTSEFEVSNLDAAREVLAELTVPASLRWRAALILQLARDLDSPLAIPQRSGLAARYTENIDALITAAKPRERDELDELRRAFYGGGTDGIDDDPEAPKQRTVRKKA